MKKIFIPLLLLSVLLSLGSCGIRAQFCQVFQVQPLSRMEQRETSLVYEDGNCRISYNLWGVGGRPGFVFYNKTGENIYVDKSESFFIVNGEAFDYFLNRTFTENSSFLNGNNASVSAGVTSVGFFGGLIQIGKSQNVTAARKQDSGVAIVEKQIICIPPYSYKEVSEYTVTNRLFVDCDLKYNPSSKTPSQKQFSPDNSPFVFSNIIAYRIGRQAELKKIENNFYVSSISNYSADGIMKTVELSDCTHPGFLRQPKVTQVVNVLAAPDCFYFPYGGNPQ
jgi:hypothetical protein